MTEASILDAERAARLATLMRRIAVDADRAAFTELFTILAPKVKGHMRRLGLNDAAAEDLAQDTMASVWHRAKSFDPARASVVTWVFTIARNRRIDLARRDGRATLEPVAEEEESGDPGPDQLFEVIEREQRLRAAVAALPKEQADMLRLAFYADKSHNEIAAESGLPLGTIKSRVRLALERLRKALGPDG